MRVLRTILLAILSWLSLGGCEPASEPVVPIWEQVKIGDLAPQSPDPSRQAHRPLPRENDNTEYDFP